MMTDRQNPAYREGRAAHNQGRTSTSNPYQTGTPQYSHWLNGWFAEDDWAAQKDEAREQKAKENLS